jgi:hypothetical protein
VLEWELRRDVATASVRVLDIPPSESGGIGRRTSLRGWRSQDRGGSSPPFRTNHLQRRRHNGVVDPLDLLFIFDEVVLIELKHLYLSLHAYADVMPHHQIEQGRYHQSAPLPAGPAQHELLRALRKGTRRDEDAVVYPLASSNISSGSGRRQTPMSSYQSWGLASMKAVMRRMQVRSWRTSTLMPRSRSSSSSPMKVWFSPTMTWRMP